MSRPPQDPGDLAGLESSARADLRSFAGRARALEPAGVLRWRSGGGLLVTTVRAHAGQGLLGRGAVLGMRVVAAPALPERDAVVSLVDLVAALDLRGSGLPSPVPPTERAASWVGLTPPRAGWEALGAIPPAAADGPEVADVQSALSEATRAAAPWLDEDASRDSVEALNALGFLTPGTPAVRIFRAGPWTRLTTPMGHVLVR